MEETLGYIAAVIIGICLGLIGGGGSILTVPVLVYLLSISPVTATAYSLFVVGFSALVGALSYMKKGLVSYKAAVVFAIPALIAVFLTRKFLIPSIPEELFEIGKFTVSKDLGIMVFFALVMLVSSYSMIRNGNKVNPKRDDTSLSFSIILIVLEGATVGVVTGIVGAGGGFLIVPALVLLTKLPMKLAVGTSLLIIAAKSLIGFMGDVSERAIDWKFLLIFTGLAVIGIFMGSYFNRFISNIKLKKAFGWFVIVMAIYILIKELILQ